jgi:hypothetical protein
MNWLYDFVSENIVHALGWTVIHSLWQGLLIGAILALSMMNMQKKSAALRYRLSFGALLLMFVSSVVTFAFVFKKSSETTENDLLEAFILRGGIFENTLSDAPTMLEKTTLFFNENAPFIVIKFKDVQGNTIIKMIRKDGTSSEIKITPEKEVFVDGKKMEEGRDLQIELNDTEGSDLELVLPHANYSWFGNGVHIHTEDDSSRVIKINPKIKNRIRLKGDNSKLFEGGNTRFMWNFNNEEWRSQADSFSREAQKMAQSYRIDAEKLQRDALKRSRENEKYWRNNTPCRDGKTQKEILEKQLKDDGFLKEGKKKYKLELTDKLLKINGEKMPADVHQRYLKLLSNDYTGTFKFTIEEDSDE